MKGYSQSGNPTNILLLALQTISIIVGNAVILVHSIIHQQAFLEIYNDFTICLNGNMIVEGSGDLVMNFVISGSDISGKRHSDGVDEWRILKCLWTKGQICVQDLHQATS